MIYDTIVAKEQHQQQTRFRGLQMVTEEYYVPLSRSEKRQNAC